MSSHNAEILENVLDSLDQEEEKGQTTDGNRIQLVVAAQAAPKRNRKKRRGLFGNRRSRSGIMGAITRMPTQTSAYTPNYNVGGGGGGGSCPNCYQKQHLLP